MTNRMRPEIGHHGSLSCPHVERNMQYANDKWGSRRNGDCPTDDGLMTGYLISFTR